MSSRHRLIWLIHLVFLLMVLLPFLLFEDQVSTYVQSYVSEADRAELGLAIVVLLSLDVFLPVPSSVVSTASGLMLGFGLGFASNFAGLMLGSFLGYGTGLLFRRTLFQRYYADNEFRQVSYDLANYGFLLLIAFRGIPMLAEMSALAAGFHRYSFKRFMIAMLISNGLLAVLGAYLGVKAGESVSLLLAGFLTIPILGYSLRLYWLRRRDIELVIESTSDGGESEKTNSNESPSS